MIVIDIETIPSEMDPLYIDEQSIKLREKYQKEETVQKYLEKLEDSWKWELGGCIPIAVGLKQVSTKENEEWVLASADTRLLLEESFKQIRRMWDQSPMGTRSLVGFNILSFDLPVLHSTACRLGVDFPIHIDQRDVIDLIHQPYGKARGRESLNRYLYAFGLERKTAQGAEVSEMWAQDLQDGGSRVADYCMSDVRLEAQLFNRLQKLFSF